MERRNDTLRSGLSYVGERNRIIRPEPPPRLEQLFWLHKKNANKKYILFAPFRVSLGKPAQTVDV